MTHKAWNAFVVLVSVAFWSAILAWVVSWLFWFPAVGLFWMLGWLK